MHHRTIEKIRACFPKAHWKPRPNQEAAFELLAAHQPLVLEAGTGTGKTAIGMTFLGYHGETGAEHRFFIVPNKAVAEQVHTLYPDTYIMLGRNEHPCLYYPGEELSAADVPCAMLGDCPHRVDRDTGMTHVAGVIPCPYLQQKYKARKGGKPVITTFAFYLFSCFFAKEWDGETAVVVDEADALADSIRSVLSYEINEKTVRRAAALLAAHAPEEARQLRAFAETLKKVVVSKPSGRRALLSQEEVRELFSAILAIDGRKLSKQIAQAIRNGTIDTTVERALLKQVSDTANNVPRYLASIGYALDSADGNRKALSYICAYWTLDPDDDGKNTYKLVIKSWAVAGMIAKMLPRKRLLAMSATIGDPDIFQMETGIDAPVYLLEHALPSHNARVYMPTDTPNLAVKNRREKFARNDKERAIFQIADGVKTLRQNGYRSLVVTVSESERRQCAAAMRELDLDVITYGPQENGTNRAPKDAAQLFRAKKGDVLVGTNAHFSKGIDLPNGSAPVAFVLRPAYPTPDDPLTQFQEWRLGHRRWAVWNHRVTVDALQVRGRNLRGPRDKGVTIFVSQQFRRFVFHALPASLRSSYFGDKTLAQVLKETKKFLE